MFHFVFSSRGVEYGLQIELSGRSRAIVGVFSGEDEYRVAKGDWSRHRGLERLACFEGFLRDDFFSSGSIDPDGAERIVKYCFDSFFPEKGSVFAV